MKSSTLKTRIGKSITKLTKQKSLGLSKALEVLKGEKCNTPKDLVNAITYYLGEWGVDCEVGTEYENVYYVELTEKGKRQCKEYQDELQAFKKFEQEIKNNNK